MRRFAPLRGMGMVLAAAGLALAAAAPKWALRPEAVVAQATVRLGDLLPAQAGVPAAVAATVLAAAPQPGTPLVWSRAQLAVRLRLAGLEPSTFALAVRTEIVRRAWPVGPVFVQAAAAAYLHRPVAAADLTFDPPLTTADNDPGVIVFRSRPDATHGRLLLICRARQDPSLLPFAVLVRSAPAELAARERRAVLPGAGAAPPPFLVEPGHAATLVITNSGFSLTSSVMPLQAGRAGDRIRALSLATHRPIEVVVAGQDQVRAAAPSLSWTHGQTH